MGMGSGSGKTRMAMSEINVTPMVDVMLVLLIIFMITAPMLQQGIEVELPETTSSGVETTDKPFLLVIKKNSRIYIGEDTVVIDQLGQKLQAIFTTRQNKQVYLQADKAVPYGVVAEAMAEIRAAGIFNISLITIPK